MSKLLELKNFRGMDEAHKGYVWPAKPIKHFSLFYKYLTKFEQILQIGIIS